MINVQKTPRQQPFVDQWLVERILKENHRQEVEKLKQNIKNGLRIKDHKGRFISFDTVLQRFNSTEENSSD